MERAGRWSAQLVGLVLAGCSGADLLFPAEDAAPADTVVVEDVADASDGPIDTAEAGCTATLCGTLCVDTTSNPAHCGGCDKVCSGSTPSCLGGVCGCPASGKCGGIGATCTDVTSNADHCGACGKRCAAGEMCVGSACTCRPNATNCAGTCVDTRNDPAHCGGCGKACTGGLVCAGSTCVAKCAGSLTECTGSCVDLSTSNANCGECGRKCDVDRVCVAGECREYVGAAFCKACPCAACVGDRPRCCPPLLAGGSPLCLEAASCPTP